MQGRLTWVMKSDAVAKRKLVIWGFLSLVFLAGCGGSNSGSLPPGATNPTPTISTISPNTTGLGGAAFTLTINGTNFATDSAVNFAGWAPVTTFVSSTQLTATIAAASIASAGTMAVTVTNPAPGGGTSNAASFTVTSAGSLVPAISLLYPSCAPAGEQFIDSVDNQLTVVGQNFVADSVVRWNGSDRPTASNGTYNGLTAQISASDIAAAGTAAVTVFNSGSGGGSSNSLTFTITTGAADPQLIAVDPTGKFAYVVDGGCAGGVGGYVSMYTINPTTGALASIGPPASSYGYGVYAGSVTVDPFGKFAYVTNSGDIYDYDSDADGTVAMYAIDATTGALTPTGTIIGNCPGLCLPSSATVDPSGKFAYVANGGGSSSGVSMFTINSTTGALTSIGTIAAGGIPNAVAVDPSGKFVYVANASSVTFSSAGSVSMYTINSTTGALTSTGSIATGTYPVSMVVDPAGNFAYVANSASNNISMYTIDATTGALTSTGTIAAGTGPVSVAVDPAGKFAYVTNYSSNDVSMYAIDATTGVLTPTGMVAAGLSPTSIAIHPSGNFAYVTNSGSNDVSIYSIDAASGALMLLGTIGS